MYTCLDGGKDMQAFRFVGLAIAAGLAFAPLAGAATIAIFATGFTGGSPVADGAADPNFTLTASAENPACSPLTPCTAYVAVQTGSPPWFNAGPPSWQADGPNSKWIAPQKTGAIAGDVNQAFAAGFYDYRLLFTVSGVDPNTLVLTGRWWTDNASTTLFLNGTPYNQPSCCFDHSSPYYIASGFQSGANTLIFHVNNSDASPTGLRIEATLSSVPEPGGVVLFGGGILALSVLGARVRGRISKRITL
jgi:hypothetical protein